MVRPAFLFIMPFMLFSILSIPQCDSGPIDVSNLTREDVDKLIVCDSPYIRHEAGCCLDQNSNKICDEDEVITTPQNDIIINQPDDTTSETIQTKTFGSVTCTIEYALGFKACRHLNQGIEIDIMYLGSLSSDGFQYKLYNGDTFIREDTKLDRFEPKSEKTIFVPAVNQETDRIMIFPMFENKICNNMRVIVPINVCG